MNKCIFCRECDTHKPLCPNSNHPVHYATVEELIEAEARNAIPDLVRKYEGMWAHYCYLKRVFSDESA